MSSVIDGLTRYFELPQSERREAVAFVLKSEDAMRKNGIVSQEVASMVFKLSWGINGQPATFAFWLLAQILYTPNLWEDIRAEVSAAFTDGIHSQPDMEYLKGCPKLNSIYYETLRIHGGAFGFRRVVSDTAIGGFAFKAGSDVLIPHRQLHIDEDIWGQDAKNFDINRFIDNPKLATTRNFRPFGGGVALCPDRFLVHQTALSLIATLVTRYDIHVIGGQESQPFPQMDDKGPEAGTIFPVFEQVPKITIKGVDR
ncbi:cytochrome p450 [Fusarium sporotrichioides]|uniref:Cytochrome p450 n=1 Tax=Fusarium sporotrichioides TaxID=5514 RepID=A0A395SB05_FUSSP|nr:cytochrome p450 [Fusarium sporotrichioides]